MCRLSSPRFAVTVLRSCSPDEFERRVQQSGVFRQEGRFRGDHECRRGASTRPRHSREGRHTYRSAAGCVGLVSFALRGCRAA